MLLIRFIQTRYPFVKPVNECQMAGKRGYTTHRFNEELLHIKLEIQAHSLDMMIKEIYENVGQILSLARLNLTTLQPQKKQDMQQTLSSSGELVGKAIKDLRLLSNPVTTKEITEAGLIPALQHEIRTINRIGRHTVQLQLTEPFPRFHAAEELVLFRILQECLQVITEYAPGSDIAVTAGYQQQEVLFTISSTANEMQRIRFHQNFPLLAKTISSKTRMINAGLSVNSNSGPTLEIQLQLSVLTTT